MEALFLKLIEQLTGAVFVLVAILTAAFIGLYRIGAVVTYFREIKGKNEKLDSTIDVVKDSISEIKATVRLLYEVHLKTVQSHSPLNLTPLGTEIAEAISIGEKISNHWPEIRAEIAKRNPKNPYDIQVVALDIAQSCFDSLFDEREKEQVKTTAYLKGVNLREIYPIIGIEIRKKYFQEEDIKPEEVDKHDPNHKK